MRAFKPFQMSTYRSMVSTMRLPVRTRKWSWMLMTGIIVGSAFAQTPRAPSELSAVGGSSSSTTSSEVTASLVASRTNCVAPCAIHFDATATTHANSSVDTFRDIGYYFAYGDTSPGNWTYSQNGTNVSKNYDRGGPVGAHVYETPGVYTAMVRARDAKGSVSDAGVAITVGNPTTVYANTATVCLSRNTDQTGCPVGATQINNVAVWPPRASNTRYLLHAGHDFSSLGRLSIAGASNTLTNVTVAKFGTASSPIVAGVAIDSEPPGPSRTTWSSNIIISDINFNGATLLSYQTHTDVLCLRCTNMVGAADGAAVGLGGSVEWYAKAANSGATTAANIYFPIRTFIVNSEINGGLYGITSYGRGTAVLGSVVRNAGQHNIRLWNAYKSVIRHNKIYGAGSEQHNIKLHASGYATWKDLINGTANESAYNIIAENVIGEVGQSNPWSTAVGPQASDLAREGVRDSIVENNYYAYNYQTEIVLGGLRLTARGNTGVGAVNEGTDLHSGGIPSGWNTGYSLGGASIATQPPP